MRDLLGSDPEKIQARVLTLGRAVRQLYPGSFEREAPMLSILLKKADEEPEDKTRKRSNQGVVTGEIEHPYDIQAVLDFKVQNPHHSTCLETRAGALVGQGFEDEKVHDVLDPLCATTLQDLLDTASQDYEGVDMCYVEVVRRGDEITGLHHLPAGEVTKVVEDRFHHHWVIRGESTDRPDVIFADFGDKKAFIARMLAGGGIDSEGIRLEDDFRTQAMPSDVESQTRDNSSQGMNLPESIEGAIKDKKLGGATEKGRIQGEDLISEVIQFKRPSAMCRDYGFPGWISAVAFVELVQMFVQMKFDFYQNRGVPEILALFLGGNKIEDDTWAKLETALRATVGPQNQHKTVALDIPNVGEKEFQLHKLDQDRSSDGGEMNILDALSLAIVTAHKVPPLLAGIQIPGKLGATNELPNALRAFQTLHVGPRQRSLASRFANTLGTDKGLPDLSPENFLPKTQMPGSGQAPPQLREEEPDPGAMPPQLQKEEGMGMPPVPGVMPPQLQAFAGPPKPKKQKRSTGFVTILDGLDLETMDTSTRMRQTEEEAAQEGRDLSQGVKERGDQTPPRPTPDRRSLPQAGSNGSGEAGAS